MMEGSAGDLPLTVFTPSAGEQQVVHMSRLKLVIT